MRWLRAGFSHEVMSTEQLAKGAHLIASRSCCAQASSLRSRDYRHRRQ